MSNPARAQETLALAQGAYYLATGVWPILQMSSFEAVTGPKREHWLVRTVGVLVGVMGMGFIASARARRVTPEIAGIAAGSAAALAAIDVIYVAKRRISPIYLLDAGAEAALLGGWLAAGAAAYRRPITREAPSPAPG